jgi:hypothetical protein
MDAFEDEGFFWLPGKEREQQAGRIKFDPIQGGTLSLIGGFGNLAQQFANQERTIRINGAAGRRYLTLDGCFRTNTRFEMPGTTHQTFYVGTIITGYLFDEGEVLTFDRCSIALDQLPGWIRRPSIQRQFPSESTDPIVIQAARLDDEIVHVGDDELRLTSTWTLRGDDITMTAVHQETRLEITYPAARSLDQIRDDVRHLQDLLTLATTTASVALEVGLWRSDITTEYPPGTHRPVPMRYYASQLAERVRLDDPQPARVIFGYQDIGGLAMVARWLTVARRYRIVVASLLSIRYSTGLYVENRFNNVISAAESFHRMRFSNEVRSQEEYDRFVQGLVAAVPGEHQNWLEKQLQYSNEPRLWQRLNEMTQYAGPVFTTLYEKPGVWVQVVANSRNRLTHHDKNRPVEFRPGDLNFIAESVFILVMLCLFRECGIDGKTLSAIAESDSAQFLGGKLTELVPRLHEQMKQM